MNIYSRFEAAFRAANDAPALVGPHGDSMSYAGLLVEVELMAVALASRGVVAGDRVLVQVAKTPQAVALYLACLKIGAVYAPINPAYTQPEVEHFIADAEPALFVAGKPIGVATAMETLDDAGYGTLPERAAAATPMAATTPRGDDDLAALIYTSGTTGRPKRGGDQPRQPAFQRRNPGSLLGLAERRRAAARAADLPCPRPVRGVALLLPRGDSDDIPAPVRSADDPCRTAALDGDDGRAHLLRSLAGQAAHSMPTPAPACVCSSPAPRR